MGVKFTLRFVTLHWSKHICLIILCNYVNVGYMRSFRRINFSEIIVAMRLIWVDIIFCSFDVAAQDATV